MKTFLFPARHESLRPSVFQRVVVSKGAARPCGPGERNHLVRPRASPVVDLTPSGMDDAGMWTWAGILTVVGLAASFGIALAWQRWKDRKKERA